MFKELDTSDWGEVFGDETSGNCTKFTPNRSPDDKVTSQEPFSREDVELIEGLQEGENDGPDWIVWGRLKDGRWFVARGGCDYTGWDCQAGNSGDVASTRDDIIRFGMTPDERERFQVSI
jgi:hypothetical protein